MFVCVSVCAHAPSSSIETCRERTYNHTAFPKTWIERGWLLYNHTAFPKTWIERGWWLDCRLSFILFAECGRSSVYQRSKCRYFLCTAGRRSRFKEKGMKKFGRWHLLMLVMVAVAFSSHASVFERGFDKCFLDSSPPPFFSFFFLLFVICIFTGCSAVPLR